MILESLMKTTVTPVTLPSSGKTIKSEDKIIGRGEKKSQTYGCSTSNLGIKRADPSVRLPSVT